MSRKAGYYWVKIREDLGTEYEEATVGKYKGHTIWEIPNSDDAWYDHELVILSDRLEEPNGPF